MVGDLSQFPYGLGTLIRTRDSRYLRVNWGRIRKSAKARRFILSFRRVHRASRSYDGQPDLPPEINCGRC